MNSMFDSMSLKCLRDSQVEMSCSWLDLGVWRSGARSWLQFRGVTEVKTARRVGRPRRSTEGARDFARRAPVEED